MILSSAYALALLAFVGIPLGGIVLGAFSHSSHGLCPPCECSAVSPTSLVLERCVITTGYVAQSAPDMEFNLTNRNITEVLPDAFIARGKHQLVRSVSLRGNHLTELPEGLFHDLLQQEEYEYPDIHILDLADNRIATLPRTLFQAGSSGELTVIRDLHLEGNCLTTLPPGVFHGLTFDDGILDMSQNQLQVLHAEAFHGLTFGYGGGILDISQNKLQELHANAFHGLTFGYDSSFGDYGILNISQNQLQVLHAEAFHGLTFGYGGGILDMSQNQLQELPPKVFNGLKLDRLYLRNNNLIQLHAETFQKLTFRENGILDMSQNKLQVLHADAFQGLTFAGWHGILDMSQNQLQVLHAEAFQNLTFRENGILDMSQNKLQALPLKVFDGLYNLKILNISHNKLQELPPKVFDGTGLRILDLAENELVTLPSDVFDGLTSLRRLRLEGNKLRSLGDRPFQWLARLEELNLERNLLTDLDEDIFECYVHSSWYYGYERDLDGYYRYYSLKRSLLKLNLGGNGLTALPDGLFNGFRKLRTLQLQSNQLKRLPRQLFQTLGVHWVFSEIQKVCSSPMYFAVVSL